MRVLGLSSKGYIWYKMDEATYLRTLEELGQDWEDNARLVRPHQLMYDEISNFGMW